MPVLTPSPKRKPVPFPVTLKSSARRSCACEVAAVRQRLVTARNSVFFMSVVAGLWCESVATHLIPKDRRRSIP
ncbi:hypothetical protein D3C83_187180 [compost metagenome]